MIQIIIVQKSAHLVHENIKIEKSTLKIHRIGSALQICINGYQFSGEKNGFQHIKASTKV